MKIEIIKERLEVVVNQAERVAGKGLSLPVLSCIYLNAGNNGLITRATNLDLGLEVKIPAKVSNSGEVVVPVNVLASFLSSVQGDRSVMVESGSDGNIVVKSERGKAVIKSLPSADFPTIPKVVGERTLRISGKELSSGIKSVAYSSSTSAVKPELASVYIYANDGQLVFVATDSFRLAEKKIKVKNIGEFNPILLPIRNAIEISKVTENIGDAMEIFINKNQLAISHGDLYLTSRLIDGVFPNYLEIIPKDFHCESLVLKHDLNQAFKVGSIFSDSFNQVSIRVLPSKKLFELKTSNPAIGENIYTLPAAIKGEEVNINFNFRYIADALQSITSDSLTLRFSGPHRPLLMRGVGDHSFTYLVMPMSR